VGVRPMTVYVDALIQWGPGNYSGRDAAQAKRVGARNKHEWCHMFADESDCEELHTLARRIGLKREWFQGDHYDLTPGRRARAIELGAVQLDRRGSVEVWKKQREQKAAAFLISRGWTVIEPAEQS